MSAFIAREEAFTCEYCGADVQPLGEGTYRDHCPHCLTSKHVDDKGPGDRASLCQGLLRPVGIDQDGKKGFMILYTCDKCGKNHRNKAAPDDQIIEFMNKNSDR